MSRVIEVEGENGTTWFGTSDRKEQAMADTLHRVPLIDGEMIKIGAIPYRYCEGGFIEGGTDPAFARKERDDFLAGRNLTGPAQNGTDNAR